MLLQEVVEQLNSERDAHEQWFDDNDLLQEFISNQHLIVQPTLMPNVRHVHASDSQYGRIVSIEKYSNKWSYLFLLAEQYASVDLIKDLMSQVDRLNGYCRVECNFLAMELPAGYVLNIIFGESLKFEIQRLRCENLESLSG